MNRTYIENDNARICLQEDGYRLDVTLFSGEHFTDLEARRLFPVTGANRYITLLDEDRNEIAIIRDVDTLMPESRQAVRASLSQFYLIPQIREITDIHEKSGTLCVHAVTDHGPCYFEIKSQAHDIKVLFDGRVLIRDSNDNRYEIPDYHVLDKKSRDGLLL